jgi:hypothetical protein
MSILVTLSLFLSDVYSHLRLIPSLFLLTCPAASRPSWPHVGSRLDALRWSCTSARCAPLPNSSSSTPSSRSRCGRIRSASSNKPKNATERRDCLPPKPTYRKQKQKEENMISATIDLPHVQPFSRPAIERVKSSFEFYLPVFVF